MRLGSFVDMIPAVEPIIIKVVGGRGEKAMRIAGRRSGDVAIVDIEGRLVVGVGDEQLRDCLDKLIGDGETKILLNLEKVSRIDSTGVGELVAGIKRAERANAHVKLLNIAAQVRHILDLSRILPLLDFAEDEAEALEDFAGGPFLGDLQS